jgi:DNA-binding IclR family transcriptional regulator
VILSVRVGYKRINIDYMESTKTTRRITQPGLEAPLHVGAAGRVLMCMFSNGQIKDYLQTIKNDSTVSTTPGFAGLVKEIQRIRQHGYGIALSEMTHETAAAAAPIFDYTGLVVAALTISCPKDRFTADLKEACIVQARQGASELSRILGYQAHKS